MRDLSLAFVGSGADAVLLENCDQEGGRIFCDQVLCGGNDASKRCDIAVLVDGVTDVKLSRVLIRVSQGRMGLELRAGQGLAAETTRQSQSVGIGALQPWHPFQPGK